MSAPAAGGTADVLLPPHVIELEAPGADSFQVVLVDPIGRLLGEPLAGVGPFAPDGRKALVAPAKDLLGRSGFLDQDGCWLSEPDSGWSFVDVAEGLIRMYTDTGWGFMDLRGEVVIEPRLDFAWTFANGMAVVRLADGGHGYVDRTGELVVPGPFHRVKPFSPSGLAAVQPTAGGGWGFVDVNGELVIPPRYEDAKDAGPTGVAPVRTGGQWGLVDTRGEWIVEPRYFRIDDFTEGGLAYFRGPGPLTTGYLDSEGNAVIAVEGELSERPRCGMIKHRSKESVGFFTVAGTPALDGARFAWAEDFHSCGAAVVLAEHGPWGVLRSDGEFLPVAHESLLIDEKRNAFGFGEGLGLARFMARNGRVVYVDSHGQDLCEFEAGHDGLALRSLVDGGGELRWADDDSDDEPDEDERYADGPAEPLFTSGPPEYSTDVGLWGDDIVKLAQWLIDSEPRRFLPQTVFDSRSDHYDLGGLDEYDLEQVRTGEVFVLASTYVPEGEWDEGELSGDDFCGYFDDFVELLSAHYGAPVYGEEELALLGVWARRRALAGRRYPAGAPDLSQLRRRRHRQPAVARGGPVLDRVLRHHLGAF